MGGGDWMHMERGMAGGAWWPRATDPRVSEVGSETNTSSEKKIDFLR